MSERVIMSLRGKQLRTKRSQSFMYLERASWREYPSGGNNLWTRTRWLDLRSDSWKRTLNHQTRGYTSGLLVENDNQPSDPGIFLGYDSHKIILDHQTRGCSSGLMVEKYYWIIRPGGPMVRSRTWGGQFMKDYFHYSFVYDGDLRNTKEWIFNEPTVKV